MSPKTVVRMRGAETCMVGGRVALGEPQRNNLGVSEAQEYAESEINSTVIDQC